MMSVVQARREPRYGSAAELASYAGISVKTVRRLVDAGKVRGLKVGRRLVIPFEDLDAHILRIADHASPDPSSPAFDPRGRAVALAAQDEGCRRAETLRALDQLDAIGDEDEQRDTFAVLAEALGGGRPSDRREAGPC